MSKQNDLSLGNNARQTPLSKIECLGLGLGKFGCWWPSSGPKLMSRNIACWWRKWPSMSPTPIDANQMVKLTFIATRVPPQTRGPINDICHGKFLFFALFPPTTLNHFSLKPPVTLFDLGRLLLHIFVVSQFLMLSPDSLKIVNGSMKPLNILIGLAISPHLLCRSIGGAGGPKICIARAGIIGDAGVGARWWIKSDCWTWQFFLLGLQSQ